MSALSVGDLAWALVKSSWWPAQVRGNSLPRRSLPRPDAFESTQWPGRLCAAEQVADPEQAPLALLRGAGPQAVLVCLLGDNKHVWVVEGCLLAFQPHCDELSGQKTRRKARAACADIGFRPMSASRVSRSAPVREARLATLRLTPADSREGVKHAKQAAVSSYCTS